MRVTVRKKALYREVKESLLKMLRISLLIVIAPGGEIIADRTV